MRIRLALAGTLSAVVVATGCSAGSPRADSSSTTPSTNARSTSTSTSTATPSAAPSTAPVVVPPAPPRSACYRLTTRQLTQPTNGSAPVPCSGQHTAQTIEVGRLDTVVDGHAVAVDSVAVQRQLASRCPRALAAYLGGSSGSRRLSRFNVVWYSPTLTQSDQGADWYRCDLIAFAGAEQLYPLPGTRRVRGVLDRRAALEVYGLCGTSAPGASGFQRVICGRRHAWRAVDTIDISGGISGDSSGGATYPGTAAVRRVGDRDCKDIARSRANNTLKFEYGWEWPTRQQWARGQHYGYCWVPD